MEFIHNKFSELALLAMLILLVSLIRVYYGGSQGLMVVWKGEPSFKDTVVNLSDLMKLPTEELQMTHPSVASQLVAMDLVEESPEHANQRQLHHGRAQPLNQPATQQHDKKN